MACEAVGRFSADRKPPANNPCEEGDRPFTRKVIHTRLMASEAVRPLWGGVWEIFRDSLRGQTMSIFRKRVKMLDNRRREV